MSVALFAWNTLLKIGNGAATEVFTTILEVTALSGPGLTQDAPDVTSHDSTAGWREFIGALLDGGEVTFTINYVPTNATHKNAAGGLIHALANRVKRNFKLQFPDAGLTTFSFTALVTNFNPNEPIDAQLSADVTLKLTGQPTLL